MYLGYQGTGLRVSGVKHFLLSSHSLGLASSETAELLQAVCCPTKNPTAISLS